MKTKVIISTIPVVVGLASQVWAQTPSPVPTTPPASAADGAWRISAFIVIVASLVLVGVAVKLYDLKRKREEEAIALQAQISDALLRDPSLGGLPVTPTASIPFRRGTPVTVEISGTVSGPAQGEQVLRVARAEASRVRSDVEVVDRLTVEPAVRIA